MTPALQFALHGVGAEASLNLQDLGEVLFLQITGLHLHSQVGQMKVTSSPLLPSKLSHPGLRSVSLIFLHNTESILHGGTHWGSWSWPRVPTPRSWRGEPPAQPRLCSLRPRRSPAPTALISYYWERQAFQFTSNAFFACQ